MSPADSGIPITVIMVEDNPFDVELILNELRRGGYRPECTVAVTREEFRSSLSESIDIILCDYSLPQFTAPSALELLKQSGLDIPFIVISGTIGEETAVSVIKQGAADYLLKDRLSRLCVAVDQAMTQRMVRLRQQYAEDLLKTMMRAVEQSGDSIFITNKAGIIEYFNPAFLATTGYSFSEVVGKTPAFLKSGKHSPEFYRDLWSTINAGKVFRAEFTNRKKDGSLFDEEQIISPVIDEQGEITNFVSTGRDVSGRKQMENELRQSEMRYRTLIDNARDAIFLLSADGSFLSLNSAFERISGWQYHEWIGKNFLSIIHPDDRSSAAEYFSQGLHGVVLPIREYRIATAAGTYVTVEVLTTYQRTNDRVESIVGIARDVTDRKRLEEQVWQSQKMDSIGTLAGGIAHDFNNILGIILGYLEMIQRKSVSAEKFTAAVETMKKAVERGRFLVRQILTFARRNDVSPAEISVNEEVQQMVLMLNETIPKTIELKTDLSPDTPVINIDPTQFHQALLNLSVNARDAILERMALDGTPGVITFSTGLLPAPAVRSTFPEAADQPYVFIRLSDTGIGMTEEIRARIFDPFFTTKGVGRGTGLGLAVVYGVVQQHHGFIDIDSAVNAGTSFTLYFPMRRRKDFDEEKGAAAEQIPVRQGNETILLVEDEESLLQLVSLSLEQRGYTVMVAKNGIQAVAVYSNHSSEISLVLTDFGLPLLDGAELARKIQEINPQAKVLMTSGYLEMSKREEIFSLGIKEIVAKPYSIETLMKTIRSVLDAK